MSALDATTASLMASVVAVVTAVFYLGTSLARRDTGGARLWALAYLLTILSVVSYYVWSMGTPGSWATVGALAMAHGASVGATGCFALGCRAFNRESVEGPAFIVAAAALLSGGATVIDADAGAAAGGAWLLASSAALSLWVAITAFRGRMRAHPMSWVLASAALLQGLVFLVRCVVFVVAGPQSELYREGFGDTLNAISILTLGLLFSFAVFVLRTVLGDERGAVRVGEIPEIVPFRVFGEQLRALLHRSMERMEVVAVVAVRIDDLDAITVAFGGDISRQMTRALRLAVRRFAPPLAVVGEGEKSTIMYVATLASSQADARRQAGLLYRGVVQEFIEGRDVVLPAVGVGVALSQVLGYDAVALRDAARAAAVEASANEESSVGFATVRDLPADPFPAEPA
jgi:hypothetical protein